MISIFFKIEMAVLYGIDYIVRNKQANVRQYEIEVFRIDEFFHLLFFFYNLLFQSISRRGEKKIYECTQTVADFRLHFLAGLGLSVSQKV